MMESAATYLIIMCGIENQHQQQRKKGDIIMMAIGKSRFCPPSSEMHTKNIIRLTNCTAGVIWNEVWWTKRKCFYCYYIFSGRTALQLSHCWESQWLICRIMGGHKCVPTNQPTNYTYIFPTSSLLLPFPDLVPFQYCVRLYLCSSSSPAPLWDPQIL